MGSIVHMFPATRRRVNTLKCGSVDIVGKKLAVNVQRVITPDAAVTLALHLLAMADQARGKPGFSFGYDPKDSTTLEQLSIAIDEHLGWENEKEREGGNYLARIVQVGALLKRLRPGKR